VPEVVFKHTLLHSHLGRFVQVLHLAAAASTGVQAEMRTPGAHALRRLEVHRRHHTGFPVVLFAVHIDADLLERQSAFDEDHLAIGPAGDALGIDVKRFHREPAIRQRALGCVVGRGVGGGEEAVYVEGGGCCHALIVSGHVSPPGRPKAKQPPWGAATREAAEREGFALSPKRAGTHPNAIRSAPSCPASP